MDGKYLAFPNKFRIFMNKLKGYGTVTIHKFEQIWQ